MRSDLYLVDARHGDLPATPDPRGHRARQLVRVRAGDEGHDVAVVSSLDEAGDAEVVVVVNPDNPTGRLVPVEAAPSEDAA